ncbi:MAG TPA: hypothetical protein VL475_15205 [Planctomycetaceae bacterium]|jgi:hypothetical protein|nr:hypothetical protein [Planctomycetaceae bacterium]
MPPLLLAADIENVIGVICVIIWILAWLMKLMGSQKQKTPPVANRPRPPARPRDERLQEEIDIFIQEVGPKKGARRPPVAAPPRPPAPAKPLARGQRPGKPQVQEKAPAKPAPQRLRPGQEISSRQVVRPEKDLGNAVQQHLQQHMAERVTQEASAFLQDKVDQSVAKHLGTSSTAAPPGTVPAPPASGTAAGVQATRYSELFRNPASLRQAMVVNLILSPPPGRKPRSAS